MKSSQGAKRYGNEQVLVIPASQTQHWPAGLLPVTDTTDLLSNASFILRQQAEHNPCYRQLIPYAVLKQADKLLLTQRLPTQGEERLHNLYSIGIGGHINPIDHHHCSPIAAGLRRELMEEIAWDSWIPPIPPVTAIINDLSNEVSRDHLGLVFLLHIPAEHSVTIRERDKMIGIWTSPHIIKKHHYKHLESWSQLTLDYLLNKANNKD